MLCLGALCWAACGKDPGFTPLSLLGLLRRRGRLREEDLVRLRLVARVDLRQVKGEWLEALDSVEPFVSSRPAEEIGCLYYSASQRGFVDPRQTPDAQPHFGRPGGVVGGAVRALDRAASIWESHAPSQPRGDSRRFLIKDGMRYGHILDATAGRDGGLVKRSLQQARVIEIW